MSNKIEFSCQYIDRVSNEVRRLMRECYQNKSLSSVNILTIIEEIPAWLEDIRTINYELRRRYSEVRKKHEELSRVAEDMKNIFI